MKTKFGAIVVDGRGKIGGHVASKNRSGNYLRTKVTPVNPRTSFQQTVRSFFAAAAIAWKQLLTADVAAWNNAVSAWKSTNIFGDSVKPSGFNLYVKLNSTLQRFGFATISAPPIPSLALPNSQLSAVFDVSANTLILTSTGTFGVDNRLIIRATPPVSQSVSYVKNLVKELVLAEFTVAESQPFSAEYIARFGAMPALGQKVEMSFVLLDSTTGETLTPVVIPVSIVA